MKKILGRIKNDITVYQGLFVGLLGYYLITRMLFHGFCPFVNLVGFPCPGCGISRATYYILMGEFRQSLAMNPTAPVWILFLLWCGFERYVIGRGAGKVTKTLLIVVAVFALVVYLHRMIVIFPGNPPMAYTRNNLLEKIVPWYHEWAIHLGK